LGNHIGLHDGSVWNPYTFTELSLSLSGYTADKNYDIWCYLSGGNPTLDSTVWTNNTTRATALAWQDGIYVKSGDTTRRYLGTIRINSTGGQTDDTIAKRFIYNYYNRKNRQLHKNSAGGNHTYNSTTWRYFNNDSNNKVEFLIGVAEDIINYDWIGDVTDPGLDRPAIGVGYDSSSSEHAGLAHAFYEYNNKSHTLQGSKTFTPAQGYHYLSCIEKVWYPGNPTFWSHMLTGHLSG
jgi:hypothetical protein